jgi:hypothetical protein
MKKLFTTTLLLAFTFFMANPQAVHADRTEVLVASGPHAYSSWLAIADGEEAVIMYHHNTYHEKYAWLIYKDADTTEITILRSHSNNVGSTITLPGPCELRNHQDYSGSGYTTTTLIKIKTAATTSTTAKYATVIPENAQTDVDVVLEQSTDLVNWTSVAPGQFAPSAQKRFFRVRSANVPVAVTGATNASPIVVTSTGHALDTGDAISISGVAGNTAANGTFTVTKVDANTFSLNGSTGNAAYTSGGTWLPSP